MAAYFGTAALVKRRFSGFERHTQQ